MERWIIALALSSAIVLWGIPRFRRVAFRSGWFERSSQTRRLRSQRRPTHGGLILAIAVAAGALLAGPGEPSARAVVAAAALTIATGIWAEAGTGPAWLGQAGRIAVAFVVPVAGVRLELTGSLAVDVVLTALAVLALTAGLRSVERSDGTVPLVVGIAAAPLLAAAVRVADPGAAVAAALLGAAFATVGYAWPPAAVRIAGMGPTILGAALTAVAIGLDPRLPTSRAVAVPLLALAAIGAAVVVPDLDLRLRRRRISCHIALPLVALPAAYASNSVATGTMALWPAVLLGVIPATVVAVIGLLTPRPRPKGYESNRGRTAALVGAGVVLLAVVAGLAAQTLWDARQDMQRGREMATSGLDAARAGDLDKAQALFETADELFADAAASLDHPAVRVGDVVPGVAQNLRYARTLADVGGDLSGTAVAVAERAGADDLQVVDGQFPVEAARQVSAELGPALNTLRGATERLAAFDSPFLVSEVRTGAEAVGDRIAEATTSLEVAAEATRLAPALLGADGDRRWIVAVVTPSEQRGAGGLAGDYAELRASDGDVELVETLPARDLNAATDREAQLAALPAIYRERYEGFRVDRFWQNLSATPDVPTFGEAIASAYPLTDGGGPVDGVVVLDPQGIAALLELTGPVAVWPWPLDITSENAAKILQYGQYNNMTEAQIDEFQDLVIEVVIGALTSGTLPSIADMAATLGPAVSGGHLRLWSPEADPQALFDRIGAAGRLGTHAPGTDFLQLVTQNDGENKIDWFMRRKVSYDATVDPVSGALAATATVQIANHAPTEGVSSYIIGEEGGPTLPGENELEVTLFSPHRVFRVTDGDGEDLPVSLGRERGLGSVTVFLEIPAGRAATVVVTYRGQLAPTDGEYSLTVGHQPAVAPDLVEAWVKGPPGWHTSEGRMAMLEAREDHESKLEATFTR